MTVKTYQAYSMAEALAAVRRDLGVEALIVTTRAFKRGGILGLGRQTIIEVTATTPAPPSLPTTRSTSRLSSRRRAAAQLAYSSADSARTPASATRSPRHELPAAAARELLSARRMALGLPTSSESAADAAPVTPADPSQSRAEPPPVLPPATMAAPVHATVAAPTAIRATAIESGRPTAVEERPAFAAWPSSPPRRFILTPESDEAPDEVPSVSARTVVAPSRPLVQAPKRDGADALPSNGDGQAMQDELAAIRSMVGEVLQRQVTTDGRRVPTLPQALFDTYLKLIAQDLSEELADRIVQEVQGELSEAEQNDADAVGRVVRCRLSAIIPVADEPVLEHSPDGRPLTIALIGPTGVGKTTTLAKLAATYKLRQRKRVGLVTSDTYRIAAVDQLRTYANIIGLPLQVALTPTELRQGIHALSACDVILIDTAGRSQNDSDRLAELRAFIESADPHEVHLVLSSTAGEKVLLREAEAFATVGFDRIVLTKLDEAVSFGMLVNVVRKVGKALSFITTGQEVPDHLEIGRPDRLADLVMGGAVHA